jgi:hypothetical protein
MFTGVGYLTQFSETVRDDEEFLTSLLPLGGVYSVYTAASSRLQESRDFAFKCLCADVDIYSSLSESLRGKYEVLLFVADKDKCECMHAGFCVDGYLFIVRICQSLSLYCLVRDDNSSTFYDDTTLDALTYSSEEIRDDKYFLLAHFDLLRGTVSVLVVVLFFCVPTNMREHSIRT